MTKILTGRFILPAPRTLLEAVLRVTLDTNLRHESWMSVHHNHLIFMAACFNFTSTRSIASILSRRPQWLFIEEGISSTKRVLSEHCSLRTTLHEMYHHWLIEKLLDLETPGTHGRDSWVSLRFYEYPKRERNDRRRGVLISDMSLLSPSAGTSTKVVGGGFMSFSDTLYTIRWH